LRIRVRVCAGSLVLDSTTHPTPTNVSTLRQNPLFFPEMPDPPRTQVPWRPSIGWGRVCGSEVTGNEAPSSPGPCTLPLRTAPSPPLNLSLDEMPPALRVPALLASTLRHSFFFGHPPLTEDLEMNNRLTESAYIYNIHCPLSPSLRSNSSLVFMVCGIVVYAVSLQRNFE